MAIQYKLASQNVNFDRDQFTATANYHVYDDASAILTVGGIVGDAGLTTILGTGAGSAYQSFGTGYLANSTYPKIRYAGYTLVNEEGGAKWALTVNFDSAQSAYSPSAAAKDIIPENQPGFTAVEMSIEAAIVPTYRVGAYTLPSGASIDTPSENDIGGTPVDQAAQPTDAFVSVMRFTLRNVMSGRPSSTLLTNLAAQTNTRNSDAVTIAGFTCAIGKLLFTGAQISRVGPNAYEITYGFAYDDDFHLRQIPAVDASGSPKLGIINSGALTTDAPTLDANQNSHRYAGVVMWRQPFPSTSNFATNLLSWLPA